MSCTFTPSAPCLVCHGHLIQTAIQQRCIKLGALLRAEGNRVHSKSCASPQASPISGQAEQKQLDRRHVLSPLQPINTVLRPECLGWGWRESTLGRGVVAKESVPRQGTFRLSVNDEKEPTLGRAKTAFPAKGTACIQEKPGLFQKVNRPSMAGG